MVYNEYTQKASMEEVDRKVAAIREDWSGRNPDYSNEDHINRIARNYSVTPAYVLGVVEDLIMAVPNQKQRALDTQVGGNHYKKMRIQPVEFIVANDIPYREANIIKYICRHKFKNGRQDVEKVVHYAQMILEEYDND